METPKIYVLHENDEWVEPLEKVFKARGIPYEFWYTHEGSLPLHEAPPLGVYYNRVSASSYTRDHRFAPEFTRHLLRWLEAHDRRIINDTRSLEMELDKLGQYEAMRNLGIRIPRTNAALGRAFIEQAARQLGEGPYILKPNRGGKGDGVHLFANIDELKVYVDSDAYTEPVDGIWLVQDYIASPESVIYRCEFVDGQFLYSVQVDTSRGFQLCPADACNLNLDRPKFQISQRFDGHPQMATFERFLFAHGIEVAAFELVVDANGDIYTYDLNTNTNYNTDAEQESGLGISGMAAIADFLGRELAVVADKSFAEPYAQDLLMAV